MHLPRRFSLLSVVPACLMLTCLNLAACTPSAEQLAGIEARVTDSVQQANERVQEKIASKQEKLASEDITLSADGLPDATITAKGELIIDGQAIVLTPAQQQLALRYHQQAQLIAADGMRLGLQGAELGLGAAKTAIAGVLGGKPESDIQAEVQAKAEGIRQAALALCDRVPELVRVQEELASQIPAFAPYTADKQIDVAQCRQGVVSSK